MRIYVASSWRNEYYDEVVDFLRQTKHSVFDFKRPVPGNDGFHWSEIDGDWQKWTSYQFRERLKHPQATLGFTTDFNAMRWAECCVLVLPCGKSAHLELGWFAGANKYTVIFAKYGEFEPELMYGLANKICVNYGELDDALR